MLFFCWDKSIVFFITEQIEHITNHNLFSYPKTSLSPFRGKEIVCTFADSYKNNSKMSNKKLYRSMADKKLCGVCGGIAEYFDLDPTIIRLLWVVMTLFTTVFPGVLAYIICALIVPQQGQMPEQ